MNFNLSSDQRLLQDAVREFAQKEIEPIADQLDRAGKLPDDMIRKMAQLNLLGMTLPEAYGGSGTGLLENILCIEQLSYSGTGAWWLPAFSCSIPECVHAFGTEKQKEKYLIPVCKGLSYPSIQFTEPGTGSNPKALLTLAVPEGDHFLINGSKRFSTFGARDGFAILYAIDEKKHCSAYILEKHVLGYSTGQPYELMGSGGIEAVDVFLDDVRISKENLLGKKDDGLTVLQFWIALEKIQQSAACIGIAQSALNEATSYSRSRMVGQKPQADLLNIRAMLAEMYSRLQAARWLTYRAAFLKDSKHSGWITEAAAAKVFVVPAAMDIVEKSRRIQGAYGYTREYKIERLYRAIAGASAIASSLEVNKSIVASAILKR